MEYYQEVTILQNEEIAENFLMAKVFMQIHLAIATQKNKDAGKCYGITFPKYHDLGLGDKIRIFSDSRENVEALNLKSYLAKLSDYVHLINPRIIPKARVKGYVKFVRVHPENSPGCLARRYAKRHNVSFDEAMDRYEGMKKVCKKPYVILNSLSNKNRFSLFIDRCYIENDDGGEFSCYGLSEGGVLPDF